MQSSDKPITSPREDCFSRNDFAKHLSDIIAKRTSTESLVIGIYGRWGDGKTSVLNLLQNDLVNQKDVITIKFNPWFYKDQPEILASFFENIASSIGKSVSNKEKIGRFVKKYILPFFSFFKQKDTIDAINDFLLSVDIEEKKREVNKHLRRAKKKFVILIDDIDRLDNEEIFILFKLIKMNLDFFNTIFILAFDYEIVTSALSVKFSTLTNNNGANFLEKIIQVPLNLPLIPNEKLQEFCFQQIDEILYKEGININGDEIQRFQYGFIPGLSIRLSTPRMITRYINVLSIYIPLLKNEVNVNDLMLIEGVRICYPLVYELIKKNKEAFLIKENFGYNISGEKEKNKQRIIELISQVSAQYANDEKKALEKLITTMFPQLNFIFNNNIFASYEYTEMQKNKRIASNEYFARYFLYSIPENDISDSSIEEFLNSLESHFSSIEDMNEKIKNIVDTKNANGFLKKIILKVEDLTPTISQNLAIVLAMNSHLFSKQQNNSILFSTYSLSARLIAELICNERDQKSKVAFSKKIIEISDPLPFSVEVMRCLRIAANSDSKQFSIEEIEILRSALIKKIEKYSRELNFFIQYPDDVGNLLKYWQSGIKNNKKVEMYFKNKTKDEPNLILVFLESLLGDYYTSSGTEKADLTRENYDVSMKIIDPTYIMGKLEGLFGKTIHSEDFPNHRQKIDIKLRTASQFSYFYDHPDIKEDENGIEKRDPI